MSQRAMALAVRDQLQNVLNLDQDSCEIGFAPGMPKPSAGELYLAIWHGPWTGESGDNDIDEYVSIHVTVTRRIGEAPQDRVGIAVLDAQDTGLEAVLRKIVLAIHKQTVVMLAANSYIATPFKGFYEPLLFLDGGVSEPKGPEWFSSDMLENMELTTTANAGVSQTLTFGRARRTQNIFPAISISPPAFPPVNPISQAYALSATHNVAFSQQLTAIGGAPDYASESYTFTIVADARTGLPAGITMSSAGLISGTPTTPGTYTFRVQAADANGVLGFQNYSMTVS